MAIPFCEPTYEGRGVRRRQSQVSTGISLSQLSLSSRVLLWGLLETWRILSYVTRGEEEVVNSDDEEDMTSISSDEAESDSGHGLEYIVNSVSVSQPNNAVPANKEDLWIDTEILDKRRNKYGVDPIETPGLSKKEEILSTLVKSGFDRNNTNCSWRSHTVTSTLRSSNPGITETVNSMSDLLSTRNILAGQIYTTSPQQSPIMIRQQPFPNPHLRQSNACHPELLTHLSRPSNTQDPLTPTTHHSCPPNEVCHPDLLQDYIHDNITSIPDLITVALPSTNSPPHLFLTTLNHDMTRSPRGVPSAIRNKRGGEHSRKHDRRKPHPGLNQSGNQGSGEPQDFEKCDTIAHESVARANMITHNQTKASSRDKMGNWREIGRSLRRIAHTLVVGEGSSRMGIRIRREEMRRNSLERCEGISQDMRWREIGRSLRRIAYTLEVGEGSRRRT